MDYICVILVLPIVCVGMVHCLSP